VLFPSLPWKYKKLYAVMRFVSSELQQLHSFLSAVRPTCVVLSGAIPNSC
jgi:hypothetical protein